MHTVLLIYSQEDQYLKGMTWIIFAETVYV